MLMTQPFFILGIDDVDDSKSRAFNAAGLYFFSFVISILYIIHDSRRQAEESAGTLTRNRGLLPRAQGEYGQVPLSEMDLDTPQQLDRGVFT